jgi:predicted nucleic acid-binding protein
MKKQLFIDSDIILDLLAHREPFYDHAAELFTFAYNNKIDLYTTAEEYIRTNKELFENNNE